VDTSAPHDRPVGSWRNGPQLAFPPHDHTLPWLRLSSNRQLPRTSGPATNVRPATLLALIVRAGRALDGGDIQGSTGPGPYAHGWRWPRDYRRIIEENTVDPALLGETAFGETATCARLGL
jgi:hypothetical protein